MLLYWIYFLNSLGRAGEPWLPLPVVGGLSYTSFGWVRLIGQFMVLTFYRLSWMRLPVPIYMWGN